MSTASRKRTRSPSPGSRKKQHTEKQDENPTVPEQTTRPDFDAAYAEFAEAMRGIGTTLTDPTQTGDETETTPVPIARTRPDNPWVNRVKKLSTKWGAGVHEQMHFAPTRTKKYHGVWGTKKLSTVQGWVSLARDSVNADDDFVVASKPGADGGHNFLVDMDGQTVGYLSGSDVPTGTKPVAKHLALYVNKKGYVATAFPCTPEIF